MADIIPKTDTRPLWQLTVEEFRELIRQEIAAGAGITNGHTKPLTATELAEVLKLNKATIYQRVKAGEIPYLKVGRFLRFNLQAVLDSQKKNENPS